MNQSSSMSRRSLIVLCLLFVCSSGICSAQDSLVGTYHPIQEVRVPSRIKGKKRWVELDKGDARNTYLQIVSGYEFVTHLRNEKKLEGWLQRVRFRFKVHRICRSEEKRVAVRIYRYDAVQDKPGEPILLDSVVIDSPKRRHTVDLSAYNIPFPSEGLCIGIKWLAHRGCTSDMGKGRRTELVQPLVGITISSTQPERTWKYYVGRPDLGWIKDSYPGQGAINLRVKAEVLYEE